MVKYGLFGVIPDKYKNTNNNGPLQNKELIKAVKRTQNIVEVADLLMRRPLFPSIPELLRIKEDWSTKNETSILFGLTSISILGKEKPEKISRTFNTSVGK